MKRGNKTWKLLVKLDHSIIRITEVLTMVTTTLDITMEMVEEEIEVVIEVEGVEEAGINMI